MSKRIYKGGWGGGTDPEFPFRTSMKAIFQGWRSNRVMDEMLALRCYRCHKIFFIMRAELQKELECPRGCGPVKYVENKNKLLEKWLKLIISNDPGLKEDGGDQG